MKSSAAGKSCGQDIERSCGATVKNAVRKGHKKAGLSIGSRLHVGFTGKSAVGWTDVQNILEQAGVEGLMRTLAEQVEREGKRVAPQCGATLLTNYCCLALDRTDHNTCLEELLDEGVGGDDGGGGDHDQGVLDQVSSAGHLDDQFGVVDLSQVNLGGG